MADRFPNRPSFANNLDRGGSQPAADPQSDGDPLAELARLIGQTDPQSNFARGRQANPLGNQANPPQASRSMATDFSAGPPSWLQTAQAQQQTRAQPTYVDQEPQHEAEPEMTPMPAFLQTPHPQHGQYAQQTPADRYDPVLYGQDDEQQQYEEYGDQGYADEEYAEEGFDGPPAFVETENRRRRPGGLLTVAVVLGLAVVGTAGAYAYRSYSGSPRGGTPPVIKADNAPSKVVPPTQSSDNSGKLIYDRIGNSGGPERVVSREEQPVDVNANAPRPVFPPIAQGGAPTQQASNTPADDSGADAPRKIRTVPIRGDQANGVPPAARPAPPAPGAVRTIPVPAAPSTQAAANAPMPLTPNAPAPNNVRSASAAVPPTAAAPPTNVTRTTGGYLVQIASQKTEADAQASYRAAQAKYGSLIGAMSPIIKRADLGDKGVYYRAMVGPFTTQEEAKKLCSNLTVAGGSCVVQRN
jgi:SPOR domain